jgi:hypothetical protein
MKRVIVTAAAIAAVILTGAPAASARPVDPRNDGSFAPTGLAVGGGRTR